MSTQSTRWPASAKATATFSVVVVFATPPFWLAKAMTLAVAVILAPFRVGETGTRRYSQGLGGFLQADAHCRGPRLRCPPVSGLLDKRLVFVCGKGGVGRSTVAAALGILAARG